jgi:hypothetical protein
MSVQVLYDGNPTPNVNSLPLASELPSGLVCGYYPDFTESVLTDISSNSADFASIGSLRSLPGAGGTRASMLNNANLTQSLAAARLTEDLTAYLAVFNFSGSGSTWFGCYDTDIETNPLWGIGLTAGTSVSVWDKSRSNTTRIIQNPSLATNIILGGYAWYVLAAVKDGQDWSVYIDGNYAGTLPNTSSGTPSVLGTEVLAFGGNAVTSFLTAGLLFNTPHTAAQVKNVSMMLRRGIKD